MISIKMDITNPDIFRKIQDQISKAIHPSAEEIAKFVTMMAIEFAPSGRTGGLKNSIKYKLGSGEKNFARYDVYVDTPASRYAAWVEFGRYAPFGLPYSGKSGKDFSKSNYTGANQGQGYLRRAIMFVAQDNGKLIKAIVEKELGKALKDFM